MVPLSKEPGADLVPQVFENGAHACHACLLEIGRPPSGEAPSCRRCGMMEPEWCLYCWWLAEELCGGVPF